MNIRSVRSSRVIFSDVVTYEIMHIIPACGPENGGVDVVNSLLSAAQNAVISYSLTTKLNKTNSLH